MTPEEFNEAARRAQEYQEKYRVSHHATADDVQKALHLITAAAGFDVDAMAQEHIRKGRELMEELEKKMTETDPDIEFGEAPLHQFFFVRGEGERIVLTWNYRDDTAEVKLEQTPPGQVLPSQDTIWEFSLPEFAAFVASGSDPVTRPDHSSAPRL